MKKVLLFIVPTLFLPSTQASAKAPPDVCIQRIECREIRDPHDPKHFYVVLRGYDQFGKRLALKNFTTADLRKRFNRHVSCPRNLKDYQTMVYGKGNGTTYMAHQHLTNLLGGYPTCILRPKIYFNAGQSTYHRKKVIVDRKKEPIDPRKGIMHIYGTPKHKAKPRRSTVHFF